MPAEKLSKVKGPFLLCLGRTTGCARHALTEPIPQGWLSRMRSYRAAACVLILSAAAVGSGLQACATGQDTSAIMSGLQNTSSTSGGNTSSSGGTDATTFAGAWIDPTDGQIIHRAYFGVVLLRFRARRQARLIAPAAPA